MLQRAILAGLAAAAVVAAFAVPAPQPAAADDYPSHPITMIVPYPAGGGVDAMGRIVGQKLSALLGQQVIIENRGGAGGMIGTRDAAKAAPDGYTLVMMLTGISLSPNAGYDVEKDFAPIGTVASTPMIVEVESVLAGEVAGGRHRARQEKSGKIFHRHAAGADTELLCGFAAQFDGRRRHYRRCLQRHRSAHHRSPRRSRAARRQHHSGLGQPGPGRTVARACRDLAGPLAGAAAGADVGGIRSARFRCRAVLRARRAGGHAASDRRSAQQGFAGDLEVRRHEETSDRPAAAKLYPARPKITPPIFIARKANGRRWSRSSD